MTMSSDWYVAYTHPRAEELAVSHLLRQGFSVYLPRFRAQRRHARRVETVTRALFPRYLFMAQAENSAPLGAVNSTIGVVGLVRTGPGFARIAQPLLDTIRAREDEDGFVRMGEDGLFQPGQPVAVDVGSAAALSGIFKCLDDRQRLVVLLDILGRRVELHLSADQVSAPTH